MTRFAARRPLIAVVALSMKTISLAKRHRFGINECASEYLIYYYYSCMQNINNTRVAVYR